MSLLYLVTLEQTLSLIFFCSAQAPLSTVGLVIPGSDLEVSAGRTSMLALDMGGGGGHIWSYEGVQDVPALCVPGKIGSVNEFARYFA